MFAREGRNRDVEGQVYGRNRRWLLAGVLCAALLVFAGACGSPDTGSSGGKKQKSSGKDSSTLKAVQVAYKTTASARTAKVDFVEKVSNVQGRDVEVTATGVTDFADKTSRFTMNLPRIGDLEVRQVGGKIYEKFPEALRARMPGKKPWIVIDLDKMYRQQYGMSFSGMQGGASSDPTEQLQYLRGASDSVKKVGKEKVRGVPTTHYKATIDLKKSAKEQGGKLKQAYKKLESRIGTSKLPVEVWLDGKGRIRRYEMEMPLPKTNGTTSQGENTGKRGSISIAEEIHDFGTPVKVSPPPSNQTVDVSELMPGKKT